MSYQKIVTSEPVARKQHRCIWCPESIADGEKHVHEISKYDGHLQDHRWHQKCYQAATVYFCESGENEFDPHEFKRGTTEEAR